MKERHTRVSKRRGSTQRERIRPFDVFMAVSLLAVFFVLVLHTNGTERYAADTPAAVTVALRGLSDEECRRLASASVLYSEGIPLYPREKIAFQNSSRIAFNRNAEARLLYSPERYDCDLSLSVMGAETEDGFFLDGKRFLARGVSVSMTAEGLTLTGRVTDVKKGEKIAVAPRPSSPFAAFQRFFRLL